MGWFSGNWHSMSLSNEGSTDDTSSNDTMSTSQPSDSSVPVNVSSNYHHKGFLPTHDAMMMGVGAGQNILDNKLQFTARPYIGQSWDSLRHYWGTEVAMTVAQHSDGLPWGKIAVGYVGGDEALTDHGRGMDLHGDVDLTHGFTFTSGMRQNSISGDANYVLVKWKLTFGGNP